MRKPKVTVHTDPATFAAAAKKGVPWAPWAVGFYARGQVHVKQLATERDKGDGLSVDLTQDAAV